MKHFGNSRYNHQHQESDCHHSLHGCKSTIRSITSRTDTITKESTRIKRNIEQYINDKIILFIRLELHKYNLFYFQNKTGTFPIQNMNEEILNLHITTQSKGI